MRKSLFILTMVLVTAVFAGQANSAPHPVSINTDNIQFSSFSYTAPLVKLEPSVISSTSSSALKIEKADFMFFIDTTGSMSSYISSVKSNLAAFAHYLEEHGIDMNFAVIEFKDITADGANSTKINTFGDGSIWTADISEVESVLASISVSGGGDIPETPMEAITTFLRTATSRAGALRFAFLLTDANSKNITNDTDIPDTAALISVLRRDSIYTSVVSKLSYEEHYHDLYTETGGKFIDIDSNNYYELMLEIADWIVEYIDTDGDGLPDVWETEGIDLDGDGSMDVDLPSMGADPNSPDIFVYYDWMYKAPDKNIFGIALGEKNMKPTPATLDAVVSQFRTHGIRLHIIEGQAIPYKDVFELGHLYSNWNRTAAEYFPRNLWTVARYCLFVNKIDDGYHAPIDLCGIAEDIPGQFFVVASGLMRDSKIHRLGTMLLEGELVYVEMETGITFMHELGHTLGLRHGGNDNTHFKPNYLSIMNYLYSSTGLVIDDIFERLNYSEYELPSLDEQHIDESKGLDPDGLTEIRVTGLSAKWKLEKSFGLTDPSNTYTRGRESISGKAIDLNGNGKIESSTTVDFYIKSGDAPHSNNEIIPQSQNDWASIRFRGGAVGGLNVMMSDDIPILISPDASRPIIEELTITEARELDLLGNPDDCTISSIMPDILYSSVKKQEIKITVFNLFGSDTTASLDVKSNLLDEAFSISLDLEASGSTDIFIPVKQSISAGEYKLECVLTCRNNMSSDLTQTIHVLNNEPFTVKEGENLTVDGSVFGGYTPAIDDTSIATMSGTIIHGEKTGQTFIILRDGDTVIASVPVYVISETETVPEPTPDTISEPTFEPPQQQPDTITPVTSDDTDQGVSKGSGGCDSGLTIICMVLCAGFIVLKRSKAA